MRPGVILWPCVAALLAACSEQGGAPGPVQQLAPVQPCEITAGCTAQTGGLALTVRTGTAPHALQSFPLQVRIDSARPVASVTATFSMRDMDMGQNRYRLLADGQVWRADITLPVCMSGRSDWLADIEVLAGGSRYRVSVPFVLEK